MESQGVQETSVSSTGAVGVAAAKDLSGARATPFVVVDATDNELPIIYANQAFLELSGYELEEVIGTNCRFLQRGDTTQPGLVELRDALKYSRSCSVVLRNYRKDGTFFWNDFSLVPIFDGLGRTSHFVGVQHILSGEGLLEAPLSRRQPGRAGQTDSGGRLGEVLIAAKVATAEQVAAAFALQQQFGGKLGEILVAKFGVTQEEITRALGQQLQNARSQVALVDDFRKTAFAVRLAQKTMEAVPEKGLPIFSLNEPLADAGGDTFYALRLVNQSQLILLADVAGHAVISSYAVASFLGMLCALASDWRGLANLLLRLNHILLTSPFADIPICVLAAEWDVEQGRVHVINAGLPHCLVYTKASGQTRPLELNGVPLGIIDDPPIEHNVLALDEGDRILFGSDGLFELLSPSGLCFQDVAPDHWSRLGSLPLDQALVAICANAKAHGAGQVADDLLAAAIEQPAIVLRQPGFRVRIPSTFTAIDQACEQMQQFVASQPTLAAMPEDWHFLLLLVAREAMTNAVIHGNREDPGKSVCIQCTFDTGAERLQLRVTDEGMGFNLAQPTPDITPETAERGRGSTIIRTYSESAFSCGCELTVNFSTAAMSGQARLAE